MVHVDQVLRANKNVLLNVLDTFIHDPLVDWIVSSAKEKASSRTVQGAVDVGEAENPEAAKSMTLIKNRLNGIVTEHGLPLAVQIIMTAKPRPPIDRIAKKTTHGWRYSIVSSLFEK